VLSFVEMVGGVLVFGIVTAAYVTADQAQTQMHPGIANFQAVFAAISGWDHVLDQVDMGASVISKLTGVY
jgi:hypothetical protein